MPNPREILLRAADRLSKPGAWTQFATAKTADGFTCLVSSDAAYQWSVDGAILRECGRDGDLFDAVIDVLYESLGYVVAAWNDAPGRTQEEVVSALREAAGRLGDA